MKVRVKRTSAWGDKKPCPGVVKEVFDRCEHRTCTEDFFNQEFSQREGEWRSKGFGHSTYDSGKGILRYHKDGDSGWFMTLDCLDDLLKFINKHGHCVVSPSDENGASMEIEIYDDYRE